ncbi:MAG: hypothetical protein KGL39_08835 [Patescibacteria group bacterium]|nr:hypothetical protein [Patescibacteria group bacterium]
MVTVLEGFILVRIFLIADLHFGHEGMCVFKRKDGNPLRPFKDAFEMDETLISNWNKTVAKEDKVYVLGDVCMKPKFLHLVGACNGTKVLIKGNHDICKPSAYLNYFKDIRGSGQLGRCLLTHIPVHPGSMGRWTANIHGHLHDGRVGGDTPDPRYFCVSVEHTNYAPILLDDVLKKIKEEQDAAGITPPLSRAESREVS